MVRVEYGDNWWPWVWIFCGFHQNNADKNLSALIDTNQLYSAAKATLADKQADRQG